MSFTKNQLIALTLGRLTRTSDTALTTIAQTEIVAAQDRLEGGVVIGQGVFFPWFLYVDDPNLPYTASETLNLPAGFLTEYEEEHTGSLFVYDSSQEDPWVRVRRDTWAIIKSRYMGSATFPTMYDIINTKIYMRPVPDTAGTARLLYYSTATSLASASENVWTQYAGELLIAELGFVLASQYIRNADAAEKFAIGITRESQRLYTKHIARLEAGRQRSRGED